MQPRHHLQRRDDLRPLSVVIRSGEIPSPTSISRMERARRYLESGCILQSLGRRNDLLLSEAASPLSMEAALILGSSEALTV